MAKFCVYCGGPLNPDGNCPKCAAKRRAGNAASPAPDAKPAARPAADSAKHPAAPKSSAAKKPDPKGKKKKSPALPIVLISLAVLILACIALCALQYFKVVNIPFVGKLLTSIGLQKEEEQTTEEEELDAYGWNDDTPPELISENTVQRPDALETAKQIGTVVSQTSIASSTTMQTGAEAYYDLVGRGFTQDSVISYYGGDGAFLEEERENTYATTEKSPFYLTTYVTQKGDIWMIVSTNGRIAAYPFTYNSGDYWQVLHVVSETDTFLQYDSVSKTFIEVSPKPSEVYIKTVARIDAATLESMTAEEVDN